MVNLEKDAKIKVATTDKANNLFLYVMFPGEHVGQWLAVEKDINTVLAHFKTRSVEKLSQRAEGLIDTLNISNGKAVSLIAYRAHQNDAIPVKECKNPPKEVFTKTPRVV